MVCVFLGLILFLFSCKWWFKHVFHILRTNLNSVSERDKHFSNPEFFFWLLIYNCALYIIYPALLSFIFQAELTCVWIDFGAPDFFVVSKQFGMFQLFSFFWVASRVCAIFGLSICTWCILCFLLFKMRCYLLWSHIVIVDNLWMCLNFFFW